MVRPSTFRGQFCRQWAFASLFLFLPNSLIGADLDVASLDSYVEQGMLRWSLTGLALAIVKGDQIVVAKGYGERRYNHDEPIDEHTIFAVASCAKPITATALAILVDEGKIKWDKPIRTYIEDFELKDPVASEHVSVRDFLCHRSGLGGGMFYYTTQSRREIVAQIPLLEPANLFRSQYRYSNINYLAAAQVIPAVTGKSWDEFVDARLFKPLEMTRSTTSYREMQASENVAYPHLKVDDNVHIIEHTNTDNNAPAGGVWSSAWDMAQFLRLHINDGARTGNRILAQTTVQEMRKPLALDPWPDPVMPPSHLNAYGLGWALSTYQGRLVVWHNGLMHGMVSFVGYVPEEDLGIVVLTNHQRNLFNYPLFYHVINQYLGIPDTNLDKANRELLANHVAHMARNLEKKEASRNLGTQPSLPLKEYAGTYEREHGLRAEVTQSEAGHLVLQYENAIADMEHWHRDEFRAKLREPRLKYEGIWFVKFDVEDGSPKSMGVSSEHDITASFRRLPRD